MGSLRYKGTDIYGLSGKVKSVNGNEESLKFDQAGNLIAMQNKFGDEAAYQYVTATSYKVEGWGRLCGEHRIKRWYADGYLSGC